MKSTGDKQLEEMIAVWHDIIDMVNGDDDSYAINEVDHKKAPVDASKKYALLALMHLVNTMRKKR